MNIHFIAMGGSVMHNLALELAEHGMRVTGSDDEIRDPARTRLAEAGLLPEAEGWFPERITPELDAVIVGMHARLDNPELQRAQALGLRIYSFPEYVFEYARHKQRIVVAGSHGKTTITAMIMHVLRELGYEFDYLVGAQVDGFERMVRLSRTAPILLVEGDEYYASALDARPKFLIYEPHIVVVSGISWDHVNIFTTEEQYINQFQKLITQLPKAGVCIYNREDRTLRDMVPSHTVKEYHYPQPYVTPIYRVRQERAVIKLEGLRIPIQVFGRHNASNIAAAWEVCKQLAVTPAEFARQIARFQGAGMRLQKVYEDEHTVIIRDFAHAPSKVLASVDAVSQLYKHANVIACLELHTFSSLNKRFITQYRNTLKKVRNKIVMVNSHTLQMKKLPLLTRQDIHRAFNDRNIRFVQSSTELLQQVRTMLKGRSVILLMSSGDLDGFDYRKLPL